jgi:RNA polymerase sigma-70 factor (ECF subfamily)
MRVQQNPHAHFHALFTAKFDRIWRASLSYTKNEPDARDLSQEICLRLYQRIGQLKDPQAFDAWLSVLIQTTALNFLKKDQRHRLGHESLDTLNSELDTWNKEADSPAGHKQLSSPEVGPEQSFDLQEARTLLHHLIAGLSAPQSEVLQLYYFAGLSMEEIAQTCKLPAGTVATRLHRARIALRKRLQAYNQQHEEAPLTLGSLQESTVGVSAALGALSGITDEIGTELLGVGSLGAGSGVLGSGALGAGSEVLGSGARALGAGSGARALPPGNVLAQSPQLRREVWRALVREGRAQSGGLPAPKTPAAEVLKAPLQALSGKQIAALAATAVLGVGGASYFALRRSKPERPPVTALSVPPEATVHETESPSPLPQDLPPETTITASEEVAQPEAKAPAPKAAPASAPTPVAKPQASKPPKAAVKPKAAAKSKPTPKPEPKPTPVPVPERTLARGDQVLAGSQGGASLSWTVVALDESFCVLLSNSVLATSAFRQDMSATDVGLWAASDARQALRSLDTSLHLAASLPASALRAQEGGIALGLMSASQKSTWQLSAKDLAIGSPWWLSDGGGEGQALLADAQGALCFDATSKTVGLRPYIEINRSKVTEAFDETQGNFSLR